MTKPEQGDSGEEEKEEAEKEKEEKENSLELDLWEAEEANAPAPAAPEPAAEAVEEEEPGPHPPWRRKAWLVFCEFVNSERLYVQRLRLLDVELRSGVVGLGAAAVPETERGFLFANLADLCHFHESRLLPALVAARARWQRREAVAEALEALVAPPYLKLYSEYCRAYPTVKAAFKRLEAHCRGFPALVRDLEGRPECGKLSLLSQFTAPVQRITRYTLLLQQYMRQLPLSHPEQGPVHDIVRGLQTAAAEANEALRTMEEYGQVLAVEEEFAGAVRGLCAPTRRLLRRGVFRTKARLGFNLQRQLFLFTDLLLVAAKAWLRPGKLRLLLCLHLLHAHVAPAPFPGVFLVQDKRCNGKQHLLWAADEKEAAQWIARINDAAVSLTEKPFLPALTNR